MIVPEGLQISLPWKSAKTICSGIEWVDESPTVTRTELYNYGYFYSFFKSRYTNTRGGKSSPFLSYAWILLHKIEFIQLDSSFRDGGI